MDTQEILGSKKTEKVLWILIIGTFILSILLGKYVLDPQKEAVVTEALEIIIEDASTAVVETETEAEPETEPEDEELPAPKQETVEARTSPETTDPFVSSIHRYNNRTINVGGEALEVAVASSLEEKILGLSFTKSFPSEIDGLLFEYEPGSNPSIWMKDMNYPIDIFWLDGGYNIVHRENNVSPDTFPESFSSPTPSAYVLETKVGWYTRK